MKNIAQDNNNVFYRCVEDTSEPIMITDTKGVLVYVNPAWVHTYGFTKEEAMGNSPRIIRSEFQSDEFYRLMWQSIQSSNSGKWRGELTNKTKSGNLVTVLLTITPFKSLQGEILGYMGIAVDLTKQKELEKTLLQQDRLVSVGMLASGLAHEIGTPLGVIRGRAEFLMIQNESVPGLKNTLEVIINQIDRISKLIRSLLRVSRTPEQVHLKKLSIKPIVQEVISLIDQQCMKHNISLQVDVSPEHLAMIDPNHLQQILLNLLINSVHAIEQKKKQDLESKNSIHIVSSVDEKILTLKIGDSGCGIPEENMKKLFQPFFTTKDVGVGTGLGLAIVAKLMSDMCAKIEVQSRVGEGTAFTLQFHI